MKLGFDSEKYLEEQSQYILQRVNAYDKLYLEFGGKLIGVSTRCAYCQDSIQMGKNQITSPPLRDQARDYYLRVTLGIRTK